MLIELHYNCNNQLYSFPFRFFASRQHYLVFQITNEEKKTRLITWQDGVFWDCLYSIFTFFKRFDLPKIIEAVSDFKMSSLSTSDSFFYSIVWLLHHCNTAMRILTWCEIFLTRLWTMESISHVVNYISWIVKSHS